MHDHHFYFRKFTSSLHPTQLPLKMYKYAMKISYQGNFFVSNVLLLWSIMLNIDISVLWNPVVKFL